MRCTPFVALLLSIFQPTVGGGEQGKVICGAPAHTEITEEKVRGKRDGNGKSAEWRAGKGKEGLQKMNGRAERAASIGKLCNECLSLASMMDESRMVFVTNAIFFESLCRFPVRASASCSVLKPARASP